MIRARAESYDLPASNTGRVFDTAIYLIRDHFRLVAIPLTLFVYPLALVADLLFVADSRGDLSHAPPTIQWMANTGIVIYYFFIMPALQYPLAAGAISWGLAKAYQGQPVAITDCLLQALRRSPSLIMAGVLSQLLMVGGLFLFIVPGIIVYTSYVLIFPIVMLEHASWFEALLRSVHLMRRERARAALLMFVILGITWFLSFDEIEVYWWSVFTELVATNLLGLFTATWIVLYFAVRCRRENLDVELAVANVERQITEDEAL